MYQATLSFKGDLKKELDLALESTKLDIIDQFEDAVRHSVNMSPVWSGAYVKSFSVNVNGTGPTRSRKSDRSMGPVDPAGPKAESLANLSADISKAVTMDLEDIKSLTLVNRAPHAQAVEYGEGNTPAYNIFGQFRNLIGSIGGNTTVRRGLGVRR